MIFNIEYCEKSQLLNTISNIFFILAAIFLYYFYKKNKIKDLKSKLLLGLIILMGIGSFAWHFYKSNLTILFDIIPVMIFFFIYAYFLILKANKSKKISLFITISYTILVILILAVFRVAYYGYVLVFLAFVVFLVYVYIKNKKIFGRLIAVLLIFLLAFIFRQIDLFVCPYFSYGTHFLWHMLSVIASYYAVRILYVK